MLTLHTVDYFPGISHAHTDMLIHMRTLAFVGLFRPVGWRGSLGYLTPQQSCTKVHLDLAS